MRGEYTGLYDNGGWLPELPPRARRIQPYTWGLIASLGTTSACAENTGRGFETFGHAGNYLRVRGEYPATGGSPATGGELPPRARRIPGNQGFDCAQDGTTSACAENTQKPGGKKFLDRNYLRVRGEYYHMGKFHCAHLELPPRARRILAPEDPSAAQEGTTSACAENTWHILNLENPPRNYLRVRGEYPK